MVTAIKEPTPSRMTLKGVTRGRQEKPDRILIYGTEGVGKTTFAAAAPSPIFVPVEDGTAHVDVARFPQPESWLEVLDAVRVLTVEQHEHQTLVLDTLDASEALLWKHICERDKKSSIEDYGYGKGYVAALNEWRALLGALERLQRERRMGVILVAHSLIRTFKNPEGDDFDRYQLKLHDKAGGLLKEWSEDVLFARWETFAIKDEKTGRTKGVSSGARVIHTVRTAAWDAKNRHSLPDTLPLGYEDFMVAAGRRQVRSPADLKTSIAAKLEQLADAELAKKVQGAVNGAKDDAEQLAKIDNRLTALVERKGA